jgi:hypothetical protein
MFVCMYVCMSEMVCECMSEMVCECMSEMVCECMSERDDGAEGNMQILIPSPSHGQPLSHDVWVAAYCPLYQHSSSSAQMLPPTFLCSSMAHTLQTQTSDLFQCLSLKIPALHLWYDYTVGYVLLLCCIQ